MFYPLGRLFDEAAIVGERLNSVIVSNALAFQTAYVSARSDQGAKLMGDFIDNLLPGA